MRELINTLESRITFLTILLSISILINIALLSYWTYKEDLRLQQKQEQLDCITEKDSINSFKGIK